MASVYLITNTVNGKLYVGMTVCSLAKRWREHRHSAKAASKDGLLQRSLRKHGVEAHSIRLLATDMTPEKALWLEAEMIRDLGTRAPNGMNLTAGGEHATHSDSSKAKVSEGLRRYHAADPATRARLSANHKGMKHTDESRAKMSAAKLGKRREDARRAEAMAARSAGVPVKSLAARFGVSTVTIYNWLKAAKKEDA